MSDRRRHAAAADRNKGPILDVLRGVLPQTGLVLEVASGAGQHVAHFAAALPALEWQPSDPDPEMRASIAAWRTEAGLANVRPPLTLDVREPAWPVERADAIVCINMIHISPWGSTPALMKGAGRLLAPGGALVLYGPFRRGGRHTAPSNEAFDAQLRAADPAWGVRDLEIVAEEASGAGLAMERTFEMPANNLVVLFRREP